MARTWTLKQKFRPAENTERWRCKGCGCTDRHACDGGCSWAAFKLCSSCTFTPAGVSALIGACNSGADLVPTPADLTAWTTVELAQAGRWALKWMAWAVAERPARGPAPTAPPYPAWMQTRMRALDKIRRPYLYR